MSHICPVCNGFSRLEENCPACGHSLDDSGRLYDYYGDYSPYRPIGDGKRTNGFPDLRLHLCMHLAWCPVCRKERQVAVYEYSDREIFMREF